MDMQQTQALIRFGLGRRGTQPPPADPRAWLAAQLRAPDIVLAQPPATTSADGLAALRADRRTPLPEGPRTRSRAILAADFAADMDILLTTDAPFRERLVWFWANHFTVSLRRFDIAPVAGAYVREAIRPHVTGRFADMLLAVMRHPAMLMYLDNIQSVGPDSPAGQRSQRGLNENLARECLELHTITPAAGYTQQDVTAFAAILTGWTIDMQAASPGFVFRPNAHEPGTKTLLGRPFPPGGAGGPGGDPYSQMPGQTPLMKAALFGEADIVRVLLDAGADATVGEAQGYTPLHGCAFQGRSETCRMLLANPRVPNVAHRDGFHPIHRACWGKTQTFADTVEVFLSFGVSPTLRASSKAGGETALQIAKKVGNKATIAALENAAAAQAKLDEEEARAGGEGGDEALEL